jgi:hypothetical protein
MQQFDLSQHIPDYIYVSDDQFHNISHQGKRERDWLVIHVVYLDLWDDMRD